MRGLPCVFVVRDERSVRGKVGELNSGNRIEFHVLLEYSSLCVATPALRQKNAASQSIALCQTR